MSAIAAVVSKQGAVLLSDGITFYPNNNINPQDGLTRSNCTIHSENTSKVFKINSRVGVSWLGNMLPDLQERFRQGCKSKGLREPGEIARYLSTLLREEHRGVDIESLVGTFENVNIAITGYDSQGNAWGISITCKDDFQPDKARLATDGLNMTCLVPFVNREDTPFGRLMEKHNQSTKDPRKCATRAFTEMIRDYEANGHIVGGQIFTEVLRP